MCATSNNTILALLVYQKKKCSMFYLRQYKFLTWKPLSIWTVTPPLPYSFVTVATGHVTRRYRYISKWRHAPTFESDFRYSMWRHLFTAIPPLLKRNQRIYHVKKLWAISFGERLHVYQTVAVISLDRETQMKHEQTTNFVKTHW
jgi:hypothetical protein